MRETAITQFSCGDALQGIHVLKGHFSGLLPGYLLLCPRFFEDGFDWNRLRDYILDL
jgi:hypothetical protein